jgi:hypothetical protein
MIHKSAGILLPQRNLKSRRLGAEKLNSIGLLKPCDLNNSLTCINIWCRPSPGSRRRSAQLGVDASENPVSNWKFRMRSSSQAMTPSETEDAASDIRSKPRPLPVEILLLAHDIWALDDLVREHRTIFNRYATVIGAHRTVFLKDA